MSCTTTGTTTSRHGPAHARTRAHGKPNESERPHPRAHARTRQVELENRWSCKAPVGSNPTPSAVVMSRYIANARHRSSRMTLASGRRRPGRSWLACVEPSLRMEWNWTPPIRSRVGWAVMPLRDERFRKNVDRQASCFGPPGNPEWPGRSGSGELRWRLPKHLPP